MLAFRLLFLQFAWATVALVSTDENVYYIINAPSSTPRPGPILPEGYVRYPDIKTSYKIYGKRLTWASAEDACNSEGARLAVIDTRTKLEYIKNIRPWRNWVWTGIYRESRSGNWRAVNGGPIPSNHPPIHHSPFIVGNCIAVSGSITQTRLSVLSCDATRRYVCEIPDEE